MEVLKTDISKVFGFLPKAELYGLSAKDIFIVNSF